MSNLAIMPFFKKNATASERLSELSTLAETEPQKFDKFVICYKETLPNGSYKYRIIQHNCKLDEEIGMFEIGKNEAMEESRR